MDLPRLPKWSPKNPLEVIAIFIALIYGICALLLGYAVKSLSEPNQTVMVWFVVLFPVAVLAVFSWLVRNHHKKLYAPGDYRSDDAFHGTPANANSLGTKLQAEDPEILDETPAVEEYNEVLDAVPEVIQRPPLSETTPAQTVGQELVDEGKRHTADLGKSIQRAYLAEGLAFQELQKEFNASVRRHINVPSLGGGKITVDGAIETSSGLAVVEVKVISSSNNLSRRVRETFTRLAQVDLNAGSGVKPIAVFLASDDEYIPKIAFSVQHAKSSRHAEVEVRVFSLRALMSKYGFSEE